MPKSAVDRKEMMVYNIPQYQRKVKNMFKAVIFDLDGTLCYTIDDLRTAMNAMLEEKGYPVRSKEEIYAAINFGSREFVRRSLPEELRADEDEVTGCHKLYSSHYDIHYLDSTYPYAGIPEVLEKLRAKGLKMGVLSNKGDSHTKKMVSKLFREGLFDEVLGGSERFPHKPEPQSALWMASQLGVEPREVLYVGDSNIDMETARNAGFFACGVTWGYRDELVLTSSGASALVRDPKEFLLYF